MSLAKTREVQLCGGHSSVQVLLSFQLTQKDIKFLTSLLFLIIVIMQHNTFIQPLIHERSLVFRLDVGGSDPAIRSPLLSKRPRAFVSIHE